MMCNVISVFLMAFVVFYMSYSNRFFLRRRTKELGVYALLGYRKTTVLSLLTTENLLVCFGAFIVGILLGSFFHKGIVFGITKLLDLSINNSKIPFFNVNAISKTACFIFAIVIVLMLSNSRFLFKTSLMGLVRFEKSAERKMKFHAVPAIVGFCCIILGYVLALDILRGDKSVWFSIGYTPIAMLTLVLVVVGTILFISSFLPFVVHISKNNKRKFYTETKIITSPNFIYRMRSNSKTLIMLTLLSAATLTVSSVMALSLYYPIAAVSRMAPSEIECRIENESEIDAIKQIVNEHSSKNDVSFLQTNIYKVTSTSEQVPLEYSAGSSKGDSDNEKILRNAGFECISYSNYMALLEAQWKKGALEQIGELHDSECILVKYQPASDNDETGNVYPLLIGNEEISVTVIATTLDNPISFANSIGTLIVSDDLYDAIAEEISPETEVLSINGQSIKDNEALFLDLSEYLNDINSGRDIGEHMWSASTVMEILYNEVYIGSVINNKTADNIDTGHQVVQRDKEDWIIVENCHEPLVSVEDFKLAHKMIARREVTKRKPNGKWRKSYIRCGICGKGLYKYGNKSSYRCHNGHVSRIRGEELEATLLDIARNMALAQLQEFELKTDGGNCPDNLEREIESLKKSKAHYAKLKFEIYDDYTKTNITRDQMAKKTAEVKQKIAEIESLITEKQETLDMQKDLFLDAKQEQLTKLSKLDEFDEEVIRYLIDYVLVYDNEHIEIRWNFDDFQAG